MSANSEAKKESSVPSCVSSLPHPALGELVGYFDEETNAEKEAGNQPKLDASKQRISSSSSSVQELLNVQELSSANKRVAREDRDSRAKGDLGQSFVPLLARQLSNKLDKLDLVSKEQGRASVIAHTPSRLPTTSTPSNSILAPPVQPRSCETAGLESGQVHSGSCTDISSINSEVFETQNIQEVQVPSVSIPKVPFPSVSITKPAMGSNPVLYIAGSVIPEEQNILLNERRLYFKMRDMDPSEVTRDTIHTLDSEMKEFTKDLSDLVISIEELLMSKASELGQERVSQWRSQQDHIERVAKDYKRRMYQQAGQVRTSMNQVQAQLQQVDLNSQLGTSSFQSEQLAFMKKQAEERNDETVRDANEKRSAAMERALKKCKVIHDKVDDLSALVNKVPYYTWNKESDLSVSEAMNEIKKWQEDLEKIIASKEELDDIVSNNRLHEDGGILEVGMSVERLSSDVKQSIESIKAEDKSRELYTLNTSKTDVVKLPMFEGRDDEDFAKFKLEIEKAFVKNRVAKCDKLEKLHEVLKGYAKKLVPKSLTGDIDEAWKVLDKAFGNPMRLMNYRKEALLKLGFLPKPNGKGGLKAQVEWYLEVESLVQNIIDLGKKSSKLEREAFSDSTIKSIKKMFPMSLGDKLNKCTGDGSEEMEAILKKITDFRLRAQENQLVYDESPGTGSVRSKPSSFGWSGHYNLDEEFDTFGACREDWKVHVAYKPPRRDEDCRICKTLEANGDTADLYDGHLHSYPTGCPRYIAMQVKDRVEVAMAAKLCMKCHDPDYIWKPRDTGHDSKCQIRVRGKGRFSCLVDNCTQHMWVCVRHYNLNLPGLKKFKEDIQSRYGLTFGFTVSIPRFAASSMMKNNARKKMKSPFIQKSGFSPGKLKRRKKKSLSIGKSLESGKEDINTNVEPSLGAKENSTNNTSTNDRKSLSTDQALKKLKKKMNTSGVKQQLRPVPRGRAQFIIGYTKGRNRGLLTLYDTGCGSVLFREGVPQHELGMSVLKTKGPYLVKGVGDTSVKVNDEYMCTVSLTDETRQVLEGWTVDRITATLPTVNVSIAEAEIKASLPDNAELQSLKCQPEVGGECDILLGILYKSIFPVAVHSLDNGLTIYRLMITPHDKNFNCAIGGPHESFEFMASQFGSMSAVFANLCQQLETYKKVGPPKISKALMTAEDVEFAKNYKEWDLSINNFHDAVHEENNDIEEVIIHKTLEETSEMEAAVKAVEMGSILVMCRNCGTGLSDQGEKVDSVLSVIEDDGELNVKTFKKAQQEGLNIEYRCPKCRSCSDCRRSFETERVSLREEAEDAMIWDSVEIDWNNKRIVCYLPLRGTEEEFLSNNRDIALKVLEQQCNTYHNDDETRELIVKAFDKLIRNNQMVLWDDLIDDDRKIVESKLVHHYIVWRVVFKPSVTTPARTVFDASQNTKMRADGTGGRCLNDLVVKGRVVTLNLVKMVLRFQIGREAMQGDLKQFYASIKLVSNQWNLQRVLLKDNLDPNSEVKEAVIKTLIWGIKCVSAQTETAIIKLAEAIKDSHPTLSSFLLNGRFVDDLGTSAEDMDKLTKLAKEADDIFAMVGLGCKGWSFSGSSPPADITADGETVSIGGMKWHTKLDMLEVPFPPLHFSKKVRGRLVVGTEVFDGCMLEEMEKFVPRKLTRRMIFSKNGAVFDILGKFVPITVGLTLDLREAVKQTEAWDDAVPDELRGKWVQNFLRLEKLKVIKFQRARMPESAVSIKMDLIVAVDAAKEVKVVGAWGRFKLKDGGFSCQHIIGRALLADVDATIPKNELDALCMGSNLGWILRQTLDDWASSSILIGDSTIALCWVSSEKKRLSLFHRNRCVQIRRGTDLEIMYHVGSECNPSDVGTRPEAVKDTDVGPSSKWEKGLPWMRGEISDAVDKGILTPISRLRLNDEEQEDFKKGVVYGKTPEILTRGHPTVLINTRVENVKSRSEFSNYLLSPTKYKFEKVIRIYATVFRFIKSFKCLKDKLGRGKSKAMLETKFRMFTSLEGVKCKLREERNEIEYFQIMAITPIITMSDKKIKKIYEVFDSNYMKHLIGEDIENDEKIVDTHRIKSMSFGVKKPGMQFRGNFHVNLTDDDVSRSLEYLYRKGSAEVLEFNKTEFVNRISVEKDGLLFCKSRILDGQRFQMAGGLEDENILSLKEFGLNMVVPVLDRFSPLSYSIADYIHRVVSRHGGYETCLRSSLDCCFIIQGMSLFREVGEDCVKCVKLRKKYLEVSMGPIADEQMVIAPPFWVTMADIYGPCHVYVPGHSMATRHKKAIDVKCYVLVFICPTTKMTNMQVIESKSSDGIVEGINRLGCENGFPSFVLVDQESSILKVLKEAEIRLKDLQLILFKEKGIKFRTCPVQGHNMHGSVERRIRSVQEMLEKMDVGNMRLHSTGLQTLLKLIENDLNNTPLGFSYGRDSDNSPLLKLIFPNLLKIGRLNKRSLDGPIRMPAGPGELMEKIEKGYASFFKIWNTSMIPKMMKMYKWFDSSQLQVDDVVWFKKSESELSNDWTVGKVIAVTKGRDGFARRAEVQYQNATETEPRNTDRAVRSLIKLFNLEDTTWLDDMREVELLVEALKNEDENIESLNVDTKERHCAVGGYERPQREIGVQHKPSAKLARSKMIKKCKTCCCLSHCLLTDHHPKALPVVINGVNYGQDHVYAGSFLDRSWVELDQYEEDIGSISDTDDTLLSLLCATQTDFGDRGSKFMTTEF